MLAKAPKNTKPKFFSFTNEAGKNVHILDSPMGMVFHQAMIPLPGGGETTAQRQYLQEYDKYANELNKLTPEKRAQVRSDYATFLQDNNLSQDKISKKLTLFDNPYADREKFGKYRKETQKLKDGKEFLNASIGIPEDNMDGGGESIPPTNQDTSEGDYNYGGGINVSPTFENIGNPTVNVTGPSMGNLTMGGGSNNGTATPRTPGTTTPDSTPSTQSSGGGSKKRAKTKAAAKILTRMETRGEGDKISRKEIRTAIKKGGAQAVNRALKRGDYNVGAGAQKIIDRRFG